MVIGSSHLSRLISQLRKIVGEITDVMCPGRIVSTAIEQIQNELRDSGTISRFGGI
jgi:hypothetical protein